MCAANSQVWQMAAGEQGRIYADIFLKHDVMFLGPGKFGEYRPQTYRAAVDEGLATSGSVTYIANFCQKVRPGDFVLMRQGYHVTAIGLVVGEYGHSEDFDDVHGWDLQHFRRVIWQEHLRKELAQIQKAAPLFAGRKQIPTFTRVNDEAVLNPISHLLSTVKQRELNDLPGKIPKPLTLDDLGQCLFARGLANDAVDKFISAVARQRRLLTWYKVYGAASGRPTEHEVVAHTILPLLLALGWSEQLLAVEWKRIDLAAFWTTPTTEKYCTMVCEAKTRNHGLQNVREQAVQYVTSLGLSACEKILVTDGGRFYLYESESSGGNYGVDATGYLNVEKIRTSHIAPQNTNAIDTIIAMTPAASGRRLK